MMKKLMVFLLGMGCSAGALACYAESCNGKQPEHYRRICPVSFQKSFPLNGYEKARVILTIKYSKKCNANWAVLETNGFAYGAPSPHLQSVGVQDMATKQSFTYAGEPGTLYGDYERKVPMGSIMSSPMISGRNKVRAFASFKDYRPFDELVSSNKKGEGYTYPKKFRGVTPAY